MTDLETSTALAPIAERAAAPAHLPTITAGGLTWRPATTDDAKALLDLRNTVAEVDDEPYRETLEEIVDLFEAPWRRFDTDSLLGHDADGTLRAYGFVESMPGDTRTLRVVLMGAVHPDRRGEGIGRELFAWQVARGRQVLAASAKKNLPARLAAYAEDDGPASRIRVFERAGLVPRRFYSELSRDLRDLAADPLPDLDLDGLRLVPFAPEHDEATRLAHNDAFRDHWGSEPQTPEQWARGRTAFVPRWSMLVVDDAPDLDALLADPHTDPETADALRAGQPLVVAYAMNDRYDEDFAVRGYSFGYTGLLGTRRAYRGRRAAPAALVAGLRAMAADGMERGNLDVDTANPTGAHGLYARLGYTKTHGSRMLSIEL